MDEKERIDVNTATAQELADALPQLGRERADAIVHWREQHGPFASVDQLGDIPGFGAKLTKGFRTWLAVKSPVTKIGKARAKRRPPKSQVEEE